MIEKKRIINNTTKKILADNFTICSSIASKAKGLMFSKKKNLIFVFENEKRISLHMLFVFFPIWAVYLNKDKEVIYIKKLIPFISSCNPKEKAKYIIEFVNKPNLEIGDIISW